MINFNGQDFEFQRDFDNPNIVRLMRSSPQLGVSLPLLSFHPDDAVSAIDSLESELYSKEFLKALKTEFKAVLTKPIEVRSLKPNAVYKPVSLFGF